MKTRIANKITKQTYKFCNFDTDRQPYTISQQLKALKVLKCPLVYRMSVIYKRNGL